MTQISPMMRDHEIKDAKGKPVAGGQLFRKYLPSRCKQDFEHSAVVTATTPIENMAEVRSSGRVRTSPIRRLRSEDG
jgi:hypothetical protein